MKGALVLFWVFILSFSCVCALNYNQVKDFQILDVQEKLLFIPEEKLADKILSFGDDLVGEQFHGISAKVFGNEKVNLYISSKDGKELVYGLDIKDNQIKSFQVGKLSENTMNVFADENEIREIINSNDPLSRLEQGLTSNKVTYSAVGLSKKLKFTFVFFAADVINWFSDQTCDFGDFYVDSSAIDGDGRINHPFQNIGQALDKAKELNCESVRINVNVGDYFNVGRLDITLDTEIRGYDLSLDSNQVTTSSVFLDGAFIVNTGDYDLVLNSITISGPDEAPSLKVGIEVNNANAYTELNNVIIQDAVGNGVKQFGGRLVMNDVSITSADTYFFPLFVGGRFVFIRDVPDSGAGIFLGEGVEAVLRDVSLVANEVGGIRIDGENTKVYASNLDVWDNAVDEDRLHDEPFANIGIGTIEVRNHALLLMEDSSVHSNAFLGLLVTESARAHVRGTNFASTNKLREPVVVNGQSFDGGSNILVRQTSGNMIAELELRDGTSRFASTGGLVVSDGLIKVVNFNITENGIGVNLMSPNNIITTDTNCLSDGVFIFGNRKDVSQEALSLPSPEDAIGARVAVQDNSLCANVRFRCDWC